MRRKRSTRPRRRRAGFFEEVERLARRAKLLVFAVPVLVLAGFTLGDATTKALALPIYEPSAERPRIDGEQVVALSSRMAELRTDGEDTGEFVRVYQDHVAPVERALLARGVPDERARRIAWPLVEHSYRNELDPATVMAIMWIESRGKPSATSFVGARGLMQVMPVHQGRWRNCEAEGDLYEIETNLCYGTSILSWYLRRYGGDEQRALLGYNGCVTGRNTPDCRLYPRKVARIRAQIERDLRPPRSIGRAAMP
ncbi:MAG TPA: lytic transglycosylase domain-containing protein [Longimicrobiales bacterium]|nr:lytic transglycosylase domain-containing protein [Longimicrobiales bacterium]